MGSFDTKLILVVVVIFFAHFANASHGQEIVVSPSCDSQSSSCVTLSHLNFPHSSNLSIVLLPGTHRLGSQTFANGANFSIIGTPGETTVYCTIQSYNLKLNGISNSIIIKGITFHGCCFQISGSNTTTILQSVFVNGTTRVLRISASSNVNIDQSSFENNNYAGHHSGVLEIYSVKNFAITTTYFADNFISSSYGAVVSIHSTSSGYISCCKFDNNVANSYKSGIIKTSSTNPLFITNSSFTANQALHYRGGVIINTYGKVAVLSSVFSFNSASSSSGVVRVEGGVCSIVASNFASNRNRAIYGVYSSCKITVDCTRFFNHSAPNYIDSNPLALSVHNLSSCAETFAVGEMGVCQENDCEGIGLYNYYTNSLLYRLYLSLQAS